MRLTVVFSIFLFSFVTPPRVAVVGEGSRSTPLDEYGATFSRDGRSCFFTVKSPSTISTNVLVICESRFENGRWSEPEIASFSGKFKDFGPSFSPDGSRLFFVSNRPVDGKPALDLWVVERKETGWSNPVNVGEPVNSDAYELGCSVASDGTLFFCSTGTDGNADIYCSKFVNGKYETPVRLDDAVNSNASETEPFIAPDGSYLLFSSSGRADAILEPGGGYPRGDIYVSFFKDGRWTAAKNLGAAVNTAAEESSPFVSNGKLYFASERNFTTIPMRPRLKYSRLQKEIDGLYNGLSNVYETPVTILDDLK